MNQNKTESKPIDIVTLLLKGKSSNLLKLIQEQLERILKDRKNTSNEIHTLELQGSNILKKIESTNIPYQAGVATKKKQFGGILAQLKIKLDDAQEKIDSAEIQLGLQDDEERINKIKNDLGQLNKLKNQIKEQHAEILQKEEILLKAIKEQRDQIVNGLKGEAKKINTTIMSLKENYDATHFEKTKLENLHHAATKNTKTLFNDNVKHDLALFAHKDKDFKTKLNTFLNHILLLKNYQTIIDKIGTIIEDIFTTGKGINLFELVAIYTKLFDRIIEEGPGILNKPIENVFLTPEVQKMLARINKDLSLPELLQLAKLDKEIHENIFIHSICIDFYISYLRAEVKEAARKETVFKMPEIKWDGLLFMTKKWPVFFRKFGESLKAFEELQYIRMFKESMDIANEVVKNPISHKILNIILDYRKKQLRTFKNSMSTPSYITLFHDTVTIAKSNNIRNPYYKEVLKLRDELEGVTRLSFLNLFSAFDVNRMLTQEDTMQEYEKESIFLKFNESNLQNDTVLRTLKIKSFSEMPAKLKIFLKSLSVDVDDHFNHMENIIEKEKDFDKNIRLSIVSSDIQLPLVNELYKSVLKCCEFINAPKALENLIISDELEKALHRRANTH